MCRNTMGSLTRKPNCDLHVRFRILEGERVMTDTPKSGLAWMRHIQKELSENPYSQSPALHKMAYGRDLWVRKPKKESK